MKNKIKIWFVVSVVTVTGIVWGAEPQASVAATAVTAQSTEPVFAIVDGSAISAAEFDKQLNRTIFEKFFHRRPPEDQLQGLKREVGDRMIERALLLAEAKRRGLQTDPEKLRQLVETFDKKNSVNARWQEQREQLLPGVEQELGENELIEQIEKTARQTPEPSPEQLLQYYDEHHDAFTEPEKLHLSVILLKIDPGLQTAEKEKVREQAKSLHARLIQGEDFAALAKEYSNDESAPNGGDMGYIHRGMMGDVVYQQVEGLAPGAITEPIMLMEGATIIRFDGRIAPKLKSLEESRERAVMLWQREAADRQWQQLKSSLRAAATIKIVDSTRYPELAASKPEAPKPKAAKKKAKASNSKGNKL